MEPYKRRMKEALTRSSRYEISYKRSERRIEGNRALHWNMVGLIDVGKGVGTNDFRKRLRIQWSWL